jgi:hypothetical protein
MIMMQAIDLGIRGYQLHTFHVKRNAGVKFHIPFIKPRVLAGTLGFFCFNIFIIL